ncbi:hypothetical protein Drorol1_Dr00004300 [Drosera rotundifolia]
MSGILSHSRLIVSKFDRFSRYRWDRCLTTTTSLSGRRRFSAISERDSTAVLEGPSCIFVANVETESQETLEALYRQARDAYYNGTPLILDDMFDRVELKLRSYGSKSVVKYPRCSIRRQSTYSDAEEDLSQVLLLASVWILILLFGSSVCLAPILYTCNVAYQETLNASSRYENPSPFMEYLHLLNEVLFVVLGSLIGIPFASASVGALQRLWRNDLVGLKGACPNCGEQVFAFVRTNQHINSSHRANCHVCSSNLEYRTKVEQSISRLGRQWVYGRIYLVSQRGKERRP